MSQCIQGQRQSLTMTRPWLVMRQLMIRHHRLHPQCSRCARQKAACGLQQRSKVSKCMVELQV